MRPRYTLMFCTSVLVISPMTRGSPPLSEVQKWFDHEWAAAQSMPDLPAVGLRWRVEDHQRVPMAVVEQARREVAGRKDHHRAVELRFYEEKLSKGFTSETHVLYAMGDGRWRYNTDRMALGFDDFVLTPEQAWRLTPRLLELYDRKAVEANDPSQAVKLQEGAFRFDIGDLLYGGMYGAKLAKLTPSRVEIQGEKWHVTARRAEIKSERQRYTLDYYGRWDPASSRGFVERRVMTENAYQPDWKGSEQRYAGWFFDDRLAGWVAREVKQYKADGTLWRVVAYEGAVPMPEGGFQAIVTPPDACGSDPVRGPVTYTSLADYRNNEVTVTGPDQLTVKHVLRPAQARPKDMTWLRPVGWALLGALMVLFLYLKLGRGYLTRS